MMATTAPSNSETVVAPSAGPWGFDLSGMDRSVKPGDDFAEYATGGWMKRTKIPADRSRYGAFDALRELSDLRVRKLLESIQQTATTLPTQASPEAADRVKMAALFSSYLDVAEADRKDATPIQPMLTALKSVSTARDMAMFMGHAQGTLAGGRSVFGAHVEPDEKHPDTYALGISQGGLGLPDRNYYLDPIYAEQKAKYQEYVQQMLGMIGWEDPAGSAEKVVAFETKLAEAHWSREQNRDVDKTYNPMTIEQLVEMAPGFDWRAFLDATGLGAAGQAIVAQNTAMPKIAQTFAETPVSTLAAWQAFTIADGAAPLLSQRFVDANFAFHGKFMTGAPQQRDRVKRAASFVESVMGEAVGREYVALYFPPDAKAKAEELVGDIKAAMKARIERLDWMSPATKEKALIKMSKFGVKIGYPTQWRDYSRLIVDPQDLFGNASRSSRFEYERQVARLGQKVDKLEWGMTPPDGECLLRADKERDRIPCRHPAAAVLRSQRGCRHKLWRDRRGHRPRDHARLRRPGTQKRRRWGPDRLVDARRREAVRSRG